MDISSPSKLTLSKWKWKRYSCLVTVCKSFSERVWYNLKYSINILKCSWPVLCLCSGYVSGTGKGAPVFNKPLCLRFKYSLFYFFYLARRPIKHEMQFWNYHYINCSLTCLQNGFFHILVTANKHSLLRFDDELVFVKLLRLAFLACTRYVPRKRFYFRKL